MARILASGAVSITITEHGAPDLARGERDALRGVAGADGPDAVFQLVRRELSDDVVGAADLERADRLQHLELQIQLAHRCARVELDAYERRPNRCRVNRPGCVTQIRQGNVSGGHRGGQDQRS